MVTVYGIPNCDTIKKTLDWLKKHKVDFQFFDYKKSIITKTKLTEWCAKENWEKLLNKKSSTWRSLPLEEQQKVTNQTAAIKVMLQNNSIIKRPVIEKVDKLIIGFNEAQYAQQFL